MSNSVFRWRTAAARGLLALLLVPFGLGMEPNAVVTLAQDAYLNKTLASTGTTAHAGDQLATTAEGWATLSMGRGRVECGHKTRIKVAARGLQLATGYLRIDGSVTIFEGVHSATPETPGTDFELVKLDNGRTFVHVFSGAVRLSGFAKAIRVTANSAVGYNALQDSGTSNDAGVGAAAQTPNATDNSSVSSAGTQATPALQEGSTSTTTTTTTQVSQTSSSGTDQSGVAGTLGTSTVAAGAGVPVPVAVGMVAASAVATGLIVHAVSKQSNTSPSTP